MAGVVRRDGLREAVTAVRDKWVADEGRTWISNCGDELSAVLDAVPDVPPTETLPDDRLAEAEAKVQRVEALADDDDGDYIDRDDLRSALSGQAGDTGTGDAT